MTITAITIDKKQIKKQETKIDGISQQNIKQNFPSY